MGPENLEDVAAAARDAGRPIGVHLYLFRHYGDAWGWEPDSAAQLQVRPLQACTPLSARQGCFCTRSLALHRSSNLPC